jgi:myo-inositol-1(or 4)-monophosphatase
MEFLPQMQTIAQEAGALLMTYFGKVEIEYKGDVDLVTEADRETEKLIVQRLRALWPQHDITGEEGTRTKTGSEFRWYIDPLDGTTNFAHGYPVFCVSIALEKNGERIAAVIYDPTRNELFTAEKGSGAQMDGRPIRVSKIAKLAECLVATGFPSQKRHKNPNIYFYHHITLRTHGIRRAGSAALDLSYVACGRFDGYWEFNLNPWDTAAGVLLVQEAGGTVSGLYNAPFQIESREVVASNTVLHEELSRELQSVLESRTLEELPHVSGFFKTRTL